MFISDVDECGTELARCPSNTYCFNTDGSYECRGLFQPCIHVLCCVVLCLLTFTRLMGLCVGCDQACVGCMGSGPARCKKCSRGFRLTGAKCLGKCAGSEPSTVRQQAQGAYVTLHTLTQCLFYV